MSRLTRDRALRILSCAAVLLVAWLAHLAPLRGLSLDTFVMVGRTPAELAAPGEARGYDFSPSDRRFAVWLVAHNARALLERPGSLFEAEPCHPARQSLALGHPGLALGLLGAPAWWLHRDPVLSFNAAVSLLRGIAALAMALLVFDWTRSTAAALCASLLYAFHVHHPSVVTYPFIYDTAWAVGGLFFARRLFADGGLGNALGLALCCALQMGESLYALLATSLVALPMGAWMLLRHGVRALRPLPLAAALLLLAAAALWIFTPFLAQRESANLTERSFQAYAAWREFGPGRSSSELGFGLALCALLLPWRGERARRLGDPRWALLAGALLSAWVATGGNESAQLAAWARGEPPPPRLPNLYAWLGELLPGLANARAPAFVLTGFQLAAALLAGLGAASLLDRIPQRWRALAGALLVGLALLQVRSPQPAVGAVESAVLRPHPDDLAFFEGLARAGNTGPLLELPLHVEQLATGGRGSAIHQVLLSTYHGRRTSGCYNSYLPASTTALLPLAERLPEVEALRALRAQGFSTLVVHQAAGPEIQERIARAAGPEGPLRRLRRSRLMAAYEIRDEPEGPEARLQ